MTTKISYYKISDEMHVGLASCALRNMFGVFLIATASIWYADEAVSQTSQTEAPLISRHQHEISYTLGLGASYGPKYLGSDDYKFTPLPILALQYGPFFLDPIRGLGVGYANEHGFDAGVSIQLEQGRSDDDEFQGMGRIRSSRLLDLSVSQALSEWMIVDAGVSLRLAGQKDRGKQYRAGLTFIPYQTDHDVITLGAHVELGDKDYNQTHFGVTPAQAARTRFRTFSPESGVHEQSVELGWSRTLDKHWTLDAGAGMSKLGNKVKNSPIVFDDTSHSVSVSFSYAF